MAELALEKNQRLALKAEAHSLQPVVLLGVAGLSDAVFAEIDRALTAHSLIKVRIPLDDRGQRDAMYAEIAERLGAARIQAIGKLIVLYRPPPPEDTSGGDEAQGNARERNNTKPNQRRPRQT